MEAFQRNPRQQAHVLQCINIQVKQDMHDKEQTSANKDIHILVVDDEPFALTFCIKLLHQFGYTHVDTANSGKDALDKIVSADEPYDLVVLDINMPEMNGLEVMRQAHDKAFRGAFILISGEDEKLLEAAYEHGEHGGLRILDAIPKPINTDYFKSLLHKV